MPTTKAKANPRKVGAAKRPNGADSSHAHFQAIARARYLLRRIFRIVEEKAKEHGLDPLAHQALIQVYGSSRMQLRIKDIAELLDIAPAFASILVKGLVEKKYVSRSRSGKDKRGISITITHSGHRLLHAIDRDVAHHIDFFSHQLTADQRSMVGAILMNYVGITPSSIEPAKND
jgi:DNA-binding MarR family transcriptional regulator